MVEIKIIQAVNEPTDGVNNLVLVEKPDGLLRICINPKEITKAINDPQYVHPTAEDILSQMNGVKYFAKLDASNENVPICKLNLMKKASIGRYQFLRMPYGIFISERQI